MTTKTTTMIKCWMCLKEIETGEGFDFGCENHHQKQKQKSKTESEPAPSATVSTSTMTTRVDDKGKGERKIVCSKCSEIVIEFEKKKKKKTTKMKKGKEEEMCLICGGIKQVGEGGDVIKFKKVVIEVATTEPKKEEKCPFCMKNEAKIECKTCEMISCSSKECLDRVHVAHAAMRKKARHAEEMIEIGKEEGEEMEKKEKCKIHGEEMNLFCIEDQVLVCSHCLLLGPHCKDRVQHECCSAEEGKKRLQETLSGDLETLKEKEKKIQEGIERAKTGIERIEIERQRVIGEIEVRFLELRHQLEERERTLKQECEEISDSKSEFCLFCFFNHLTNSK